MERNLPDHACDAPVDIRRSLYVEKFMKTLPLRLLLEASQGEVEYAIEEDYDQDEDVAVVARLVHRDNEAEALHDQGQD